MANLYDYLDWRGDIPLKDDSFNEVDNLILSWLSYVDLGQIMPSGICEVNVSIKEAGKRYFEKNTLEEKMKDHMMARTSALLFEKLMDSERFSKIKIINYVNQVSEESQKQFSAMTFEISNDFIYVAFRGTDDSIVGWREDFNMVFLPSVPSQEEAVDYINTSLANFEGKLIIGGHSKGGNLAVYAGVKCDSRIKKNIIKIYNNDGPGFSPDFIKSDEYQEIVSRITTIVPESSVVGMLFSHDEEYEIVRSSQKGIMQHDAGTWEVYRNRLVYLDSVSSSSKFVDHSIKEWIQNLSEDERKIFIEGLFSILEAPGAKTVNEIYDMGVRYIGSILKSFGSMSPDMRQMLLKVVKSLLDIMSTNIKASLKKDK